MYECRHPSPTNDFRDASNNGSFVTEDSHDGVSPVVSRMRLDVESVALAVL